MGRDTRNHNDNGIDYFDQLYVEYHVALHDDYTAAVGVHHHHDDFGILIHPDDECYAAEHVNVVVTLIANNRHGTVDQSESVFGPANHDHDEVP